MIKTIKENIILQGKSNDNWLVDLPAYIQIQKNHFYKLNIRKSNEQYKYREISLILEFEKNSKSNHTIVLPLTPVQETHIKTYQFEVDWGDNTPIQVVTSWDSINKSHTYSDEFLNSNNTFQIKINRIMLWI